MFFFVLFVLFDLFVIVVVLSVIVVIVVGVRPASRSFVAARAFSGFSTHSLQQPLGNRFFF
jgi:hypothetical protein